MEQARKRLPSDRGATLVLDRLTDACDDTESGQMSPAVARALSTLSGATVRKSIREKMSLVDEMTTGTFETFLSDVFALLTHKSFRGGDYLSYLIGLMHVVMATRHRSWIRRSSALY